MPTTEVSVTVEPADPKKRMTKRQRATELAAKFVAEVVHARGRYAAMVRFKRLACSQGRGSGPPCYPVGPHARSPVLDCLRLSGG